MDTLALILLDQAAGGGGMSGIFMIVAMIVIFYFFMIRPQQKKQKEIKRQRDAMTKGDKVITSGGIHGRIKSDEGNSMLIEIANGVVIRVDKASLYPATEQPVADKGKKAESEEVKEVKK